VLWSDVMAVNAHPDYDAAAQRWSRARNVIAGEDAIKVPKEKIFAQVGFADRCGLGGLLMRTSFFGAAARTLEEFLDLIFRRRRA